MHSLLYNFLDEWLYKFNAELFVCRRISVGSIDRLTLTLAYPYP